MSKYKLSLSNELKVTVIHDSHHSFHLYTSSSMEGVRTDNIACCMLWGMLGLGQRRRREGQNGLLFARAVHRWTDCWSWTLYPVPTRGTDDARNSTGLSGRILTTRRTLPILGHSIFSRVATLHSCWTSLHSHCRSTSRRTTM